MNNEEKYLFDLNGYLVVEDILEPRLVQALNESLDHQDIRLREANLWEGAEVLKGKHGRGEYGGVLDWPEPWCHPWRELLALPATMRYMLEIIGEEFRFEGMQGITNTTGSEGQILHGGGVPHGPNLETGFFHRFENGRIYSGEMSVSYQLTDVGPDDGGFCCVPGSHKSNYDCGWPHRRLEIGADFVKQLPARAGSAIIFNEALTHGALRWKGSHERRVAIYRYITGIMSTGRPTLPQQAETIAAMSPLHAALLEPPYLSGRPNIARLLEEMT